MATTTKKTLQDRVQCSNKFFFSRALQKLETVGQASQEALRSELQGEGSWRAVHDEVLVGQVS